MPDDVTAPPSIDARVRFRLALAKIERDVLVSGLTDEEIDSLVATLAPAAPVEGMVERYKAALDQISDVCNQSLPGIDLALNIRGIIATLDKPQGVGDNKP